MLRNKTVLKYVLPLFLICPMIMVGGFGLTFAEIFTLVYAVVFLVLRGNDFKLPAIIYIFIIITCLGRIGAFVNSLNYNLPVDYTKLIFLFIILIQCSSFFMARNAAITFEELLVTRYAKIIIGCVFLLAVAYTLSGAGVRTKLMMLFWPPMDLVRLTDPRFPGLGINSNVYAYMVYIFFIFSLKNYFENKNGFLIPFFCLTIIILCASKTILALTFVTLLIFPVYFLLWSRRQKGKVKRKRSLTVLGITFLIGVTGVIVSQNEAVTDYIIILRRLNDLLENTSSIDNRNELWSLGMERVWMAPILGIDVVQSKMVSDTVPLLFANPHNEFIFYWMSLGILGFISYPLVIIYFIVKNSISKFNIAWLFLYLSLIMQMMFDGAFSYLRFQFFIFILLGLNYNDLSIRKKQHA